MGNRLVLWKKGNLRCTRGHFFLGGVALLGIHLTAAQASDAFQPDRIKAKIPCCSGQDFVQNFKGEERYFII